MGSLIGKGELLKQKNKVKVISFGYRNVNKLNFVRSCFNSIKFSKKSKQIIFIFVDLKLVR